MAFCENKPIHKIMIFAHVNLWISMFTCTPEGYWKDTGRVTDIR